ncbi:hypothetical protein FGE12_07895 [Aggregicoccus sp. 17bor-14]|uniref:hypothetical protein n=1 Tax=Myxococcaceae TaxID=31 RepID=UPI00129D06A6|nr:MULTISPECIES: hypothetical protein [Myxococcaceae]MBF5042318.1 hypothetical protein [Simulacricoccus sp. 17bor-14]MRI88092.1 hypothetical protein [Aggregicoccus sp. 17bor-14]
MSTPTPAVSARALLLLAGLAVFSAGCPAPLTVEPTSTSPECAGLVPSSSARMIDDRYDIPAANTCRGGTSEGTGYVALVDTNVEGLDTRFNWHSRTPAGSPVATSGGINRFPLVPQPVGYQAITSFLEPGPSDATVLDGFRPDLGPGPFTGLSDYGDVERRWTLAQDPLGGSATLYRRVLPTGNHPFTVALRRFDAAALPRGPAVQVTSGVIGDRPAWMVVGVSTTGPALAIWEWRAHAVARWVAADGTLLTGEFYDELVPTVPTHLELVPLLDGSLVLQRDGAWVARFTPGSTAVDPAPAWLAARPNHTLRLVHARGGYALLPFEGAAATPCRQTVEVHAPSGALCASVQLYQGPSACTTRDVEVGWDGTLVLQRANETCTGATCTCSHRWWSGLLR